MKAVAYVRVSTNKQAEEGCSLAAQEERIRAYCTMSGLVLDQVLREEGVSAAKPLAERRMGAQLLELIRSRQVEHVVSLKLDRLFRDAVDALTITKAWDQTHMALHLVDMGGLAMSTGSAMGRMILTMMAGFAELERNLISERTAAALQHLRAQGRHVGSPRLGVAVVDGLLEPVEAELAAVHWIHDLADEGLTLRDIAGELTAAGYRTKRGGAWHPQTVARVLARGRG